MIPTNATKIFPIIAKKNLNFFQNSFRKIFKGCHCGKTHIFNPLRANFTKWSNTLKQFIGKLPTNCLSVFDHFVKLPLKGLTFTCQELKTCSWGGYYFPNWDSAILSIYLENFAFLKCIVYGWTLIHQIMFLLIFSRSLMTQEKVNKLQIFTKQCLANEIWYKAKFFSHAPNHESSHFHFQSWRPHEAGFDDYFSKTKTYQQKHNLNWTSKWGSEVNANKILLGSMD